MFKIFFLRYRDFGVDLFYHVFIRLANYFAPQYSSSVYITAKTFFRLALFRGGGGGGGRAGIKFTEFWSSFGIVIMETDQM